MKKLMACITLLLLTLGQAWATAYTVGPGGTYATFTALHAADANLSGDTVTLTGSFTDSGTSQMLHNSTSGCVIDFAGYTVTFSSLASGVYPWRFNSSTNGTIEMKNGTVVTSGLFLYMTSAADILLTNMTVVSSGAGQLIYDYSANASITMTGCALSFSSITGRVASDMLIKVGSASPTVTITGSTFSTCGTGISYETLATGLSVRTSTFNSCGTVAISCGAGGDAVIANNTITCGKGLGSFSDAVRFGIDFSTPYGSVCSARIDSNSVAINGSANIRFAKAGDYDQGIGGVISHNTIGGEDSTTYCLSVQARGVAIHHNTMLGNRNPAGHLMMIGADAGTDLDRQYRATGISIYQNDFALDYVPRKDGSANFHAIVVKADSCFVFNNSFTVNALITNESVTNSNLVYWKGGDKGRCYNNDFTTVDDRFYGVKLAAQGTKHVEDFYLFNNDFVSGWEYPLRLEGFLECVGLSIADNRFYPAAAYLDSTSAAVSGLTSKSWWDDGNFTDSTSWRMDYGGRGGLTGMTDSAQGFQRVGISTTSPGQPAISRTQSGFRTPVEALTSIRSIGGLTGVELEQYVNTPQDRGNLAIWQFGPHPVGVGTYQSVAGDTLQVKRAFR